MKRIVAFFLFALCLITLSVSSLAADKSSLAALLNEVCDPAEYTAETYQPYQKAVNGAVAIYEKDGATQEEIDQAAAELKTAKNGLISILNRDLLLEYVDEIEDYLYSTTYDLSPEAETLLTDARKEFLALYEDLNLTKEQLNGAKKTYESVMQIAGESKEIQKFSAEEADKDVVIPEKVISNSGGVGRVTTIRLILLGIGIVGIVLGTTASILYFKPPKFLQ